MTYGIGGKGSRGDETPGDFFAQVSQRQAVVGSQGSVGSQGCQSRQSPIQGGYGVEAIQYVCEGNPVQLVVEQPGGKRDSGKADNRPQIIFCCSHQSGPVWMELLGDGFATSELLSMRRTALNADKTAQPYIP